MKRSTCWHGNRVGRRPFCAGGRSTKPAISNPDCVRVTPSTCAKIVNAGGTRRRLAQGQADADREIVRQPCRNGGRQQCANRFLRVVGSRRFSGLGGGGTSRGSLDRLDALFGIARFVAEPDLDNFFAAAVMRMLVGTRPCNLELPEDQRWTAALHEKVRTHSTSSCEIGIRETLVLLAVHGNRLFEKRLGIDIAISGCSALVNRLLTAIDPTTGCFRTRTIFQTMLRSRHRTRFLRPSSSAT